MIPVIDNRPSAEDRPLYGLRQGDTFIWNEYLCAVVNTTGAHAHSKDDGHVLCITIGSAQLLDIDKYATVTPCDCEINIVA